MPNIVQSGHFQIVKDLLQRQEDALSKLDSLNEKVENALKDVNQFRDESADLSVRPKDPSIVHSDAA